MDILLVLLLVAAAIGIRASGPCTTYANAQLWQAGVTMEMANNGHWLWPHDQKGSPPRKPQLYGWLAAPVLMATGIYDDFTFRVPTMLAALGTGVLVYLLGVRWYGRRAGLLAALFWATTLGVPKLTYFSTTDMLFTFWVTASIFCVDRLMFHPARKQWPWAIGFWAAMTVAAWSKGWGVVNLPIVGFFVMLGAVCQPGFRVLWRAEWASSRTPWPTRRSDSRRGRAGLVIRWILRLVWWVGERAGLLARLILRRVWLAIERTRLLYGLPIMLTILGRMLCDTWIAGGKEFEEVFRFEVIQRFFGSGDAPTTIGGIVMEGPGGAGAPPLAMLFYFGLPASILAISTMSLVRPREWFKRRGQIVVPLCWIVAVLVPFSLSKGFRADYLLPCHAPLALMAAWAVEQVARRGRGGGRLNTNVRHTIAGVPVVVGAGLIAFGAMMLPGFVLGGKPLPIINMMGLSPYRLSAFGQWALAGLIPLGVIVLVGGVIASLKWRIRTVAAFGCIGMLGVALLNTHVISRHARTGDGQKMRSFAVAAREIVNDDEFVMYYAEKHMFELSMGRHGTHLPWGGPTVKRINRCQQPWLVTSGRGLVAMGAVEFLGSEGYGGGMLAHDYAFHPEWLGDVVLTADAIEEDDWGNIYLIRLARPIKPMPSPAPPQP